MKKNLSIDDLEIRGINHDKDWHICRVDQKRNLTDVYHIENWAEENCTQRFHSYGRTYWFESAQDRTLFALRWV